MGPDTFNTLLLQACGFQMRGTAIPPELMTMKVVGDNKSDFYRLVTTRLKASGVTLADKEGLPVLTLSGVRSSSQVASVDSIGQDREYLLGYSTQFTVSMPGKPTQVFPITFNRSFLNKPDAALASSREQEQLGKEMQADPDFALSKSEQGHHRRGRECSTKE